MLTLLTAAMLVSGGLAVSTARAQSAPAPGGTGEVPGGTARDKDGDGQGGTARDKSPFQAFDRAQFEAHAKTALGATDEQLSALRAEIDDGTSVASAVDALLRALSKAYDQAVTSAEDGDPGAALELTKVLTSTRDPYLRAHTRYQLGRVFLDADDPEKATEILGEYLAKDRNLGAVSADVLYFYAQSLAEVPLPEEAIHAFRKFLEHFPESPERYRASATQQIATLDTQLDNPLHSLADSMKDVERRIRKTNTGKPTQAKQEAIIQELEEIIEVMEEQEKQSSGGAGGLGAPSAPAGTSQVAAGATRIGNLKRNSGVDDKWNKLEDREREKIETDLQTKLNGRYRGLLQDYYKKLGSGNAGQPTSKPKKR